MRYLTAMLVSRSLGIAGLVVDQDVVIISVRGIIGKSKSPESALR